MERVRSRPDNTISMEALEKEYGEELKGESARRRLSVIVHKRTGDVIGWASIRWWRPFVTSCDIGLAIASKKFRGKGIGTEVTGLLTGLLTGLGFDQYNMHKVELFTRPDNRAMIGSAEKNGFKVEGKVRETFYFNGEFHDGVLMGVLRNSKPRNPPYSSTRLFCLTKLHSCANQPTTYEEVSLCVG